jgi:hypothetical protein
MCKSNLAREYKTNMLMYETPKELKVQGLTRKRSFAIDSFMNIASKTTEGGARTLVLAALTKKEENGYFYTDYIGSREEYEKLVCLYFTCASLLGLCFMSLRQRRVHFGTIY